MLNCAPMSSGLIALSGFANKPVLNIIDQRPNLQMVQQSSYRKTAAANIVKLYHQTNLSFATFVITDRAQVNFQTCLDNIASAGGRVDKIILLNSVLGYQAYERPLVIFGSLNLNSFVSSAEKPRTTMINNLPVGRFPNQSELLSYILATLH